MSVTFGYWNLRGIAEPIRYLLRYVGDAYEDRQFVHTPDKSNWFSVKFTLGLEFPNLPYLQDGDLTLTQSLCILRYLARKHGLAGKDFKETTTLDMLEQHAVDLLVNLNKLSYRPDFQQEIKPYLDLLPDKLGLFSKYLDQKKFLLGDRITYVDFYLYEAIDHHRMLCGSCLNQFENLSNFMERIECLPNISKYMESDEFKRWPLYAARAHFGGKGEFPMFK